MIVVQHDVYDRGDHDEYAIAVLVDEMRRLYRHGGWSREVLPYWSVWARVDDGPSALVHWTQEAAYQSGDIWVPFEGLRNTTKIADVRLFNGEFRYDLTTGELTVVEMGEYDDGRRMRAPPADRKSFAAFLRELLPWRGPIRNPRRGDWVATAAAISLASPLEEMVLAGALANPRCRRS